jgi:hypothetical protein
MNNFELWKERLTLEECAEISDDCNCAFACAAYNYCLGKGSKIESCRDTIIAWGNDNNEVNV